MSLELTRRACLALPIALGGCAKLVPRNAGPPTKAKAPPFELTGHDGKRYALSQLIERGPAVVEFYRGFW